MEAHLFAQCELRKRHNFDPSFYIRQQSAELPSLPSFGNSACDRVTRGTQQDHIGMTAGCDVSSMRARDEGGKTIA